MKKASVKKIIDSEVCVHVCIISIVLMSSLSSCRTALCALWICHPFRHPDERGVPHEAEDRAHHLLEGKAGEHV